MDRMGALPALHGTTLLRDRSGGGRLWGCGWLARPRIQPVHRRLTPRVKVPMPTVWGSSVVTKGNKWAQVHTLQRLAARSPVRALRKAAEWWLAAGETAGFVRTEWKR